MIKKIENSEEITAKFKEWLEKGLKSEDRSWSIRELARRCGMSDAHIINAKSYQASFSDISGFMFSCAESVRQVDKKLTNLKLGLDKPPLFVV